MKALRHFRRNRSLCAAGAGWQQLESHYAEYTDVEERKIALGKLIGIEDMAYIEIDGFKRVYAISDEDLGRETDVKTSAAHFRRFEFNEAAKKAIKYGAAVKLGCDHPNYNMSALIPLNQLESLREDLN